MRKFVLNQFREQQDMSQSEQKQRKLMAYDYWKLVSDLSERKYLHELDGGAENKLSPREMSRRSAARAGLRLPEEYIANGQQSRS